MVLVFLHQILLFFLELRYAWLTFPSLHAALSSYSACFASVKFITFIFNFLYIIKVLYLLYDKFAWSSIVKTNGKNYTIK